MAKTPRPHQPADATKGPGLAALRSQIDRIDRELVGLMNERAEVARQIGHIKKSSGQATYDPAREEVVLERVAAANPGPLSAESLKAIYRELISGSRAIEQPLRVAHLGPAWTYSHLAALHRFGSAVEFVPVASISAAFEEVHAGHSHYGVVPLENSTDGRIADTLDNFSRLPVKICAEVPLRIHHTLLAPCDRSAVQEVYSRPQALSQCRNWLARHLPAARLVEVTSTSAAAEMAAKKPHAAAIASRQAGVHYGLNVLAEKIEDVATPTPSEPARTKPRSCSRSSTAPAAWPTPCRSPRSSGSTSPGSSRFRCRARSGATSSSSSSRGTARTSASAARSRRWRSGASGW
jgi:chorismate mutase/prephenate dehydratase